MARRSNEEGFKAGQAADWKFDFHPPREIRSEEELKQWNAMLNRPISGPANLSR